MLFVIIQTSYLILITNVNSVRSVSGKNISRTKKHITEELVIVLFYCKFKNITTDTNETNSDNYSHYKID